MENREDKELDSLIRKMLRDTPMQHPSEDFTQKVMADLELVSQTHKEKSRALIPAKLWISASLIYLAIIIIYFSSSSDLSQGWFSKIGVRLNSLFSFEVPGLELSTILIYSVLCVSMMVLVQVLILGKRRSF